jgi:hypothetical protein
VRNGDDCDDTSDDRWPGAPETCNETDDDCDGEIDEGEDAAATWYLDADGDGHGHGGTTSRGCTAPDGYVALADDCDDARADTYPGAPETDCTDERDYNCDGFGGATDNDGDGAPACRDCDDGDVTRAPSLREVCDPTDVDEDCDGLADNADPSASGVSTYYVDADGDGCGGYVTQRACDARDGLVAVAGDCNDADPTVSPLAEERCDPDDVDEDCDGVSDDADPGATGGTTGYADADGDGYGDPGTSAPVCDYGSGWVPGATDCDDTDAGDYPGAREVAGNGDDEDCDGTETCYIDNDGDGFGGAGFTTSGDLTCAGPGFTALAGDCDDGNADVNPIEREVIADAIDQDCDGADLCYRDADGDGYAGTRTVASASMGCTASGVGSTANDCDDTTAATNPGAEDIPADGVDNDCNGAETCYFDADLDRYGSTVTMESADLDCTDRNEARSATDCDDYYERTYPGATEECDGYDNNCDGRLASCDYGYPM